MFQSTSKSCINNPLCHVVDQWRFDRLREARGILADLPQHSESLVILAARVVVGQTGDPVECDVAADLLRLLDPRPARRAAP